MTLVGGANMLGTWQMGCEAVLGAGHRHQELLGDANMLGTLQMGCDAVLGAEHRHLER